MKRLLILDTETSGLDPEKDHLVEVGLVLWSVEERETVKRAGFRWDPEAKTWWRQMPPEDIDALPFPCTAEAPAPKRRWR